MATNMPFWKELLHAGLILVPFAVLAGALWIVCLIDARGRLRARGQVRRYRSLRCYQLIMQRGGVGDE